MRKTNARLTKELKEFTDAYNIANHERKCLNKDLETANMINAHQAAQLQVKEEAINQLNGIVEMLRGFVDKMLPVTPGAIELFKLHHPTKVRNGTPFEGKSLTPNRPC